jgi:hypothetical protein
MDDFGFEKAIDRLSQRIVITVADAAHRGCDACIGEPFALFDRQILAASVAVMNNPHILSRAAFMDRLFQGIQHETCMPRGADKGEGFRIASLGSRIGGGSRPNTTGAPKSSYPLAP